MRAAILILCALLIGCSATKRATSYESKTTDRTVANVVDVATRDSTVAKETNTSSVVEIINDKEMVIREYDTDKPVITETGRPPLKREVLIRDKGTVTEKQASTTTEITAVSDSSAHVDRSKCDITTDTHIKEHVKKRSVPWWMIIAAIIACTALLFRLK